MILEVKFLFGILVNRSRFNSMKLSIFSGVRKWDYGFSDCRGSIIHDPLGIEEP